MGKQKHAEYIGKPGVKTHIIYKIKPVLISLAEFGAILGISPRTLRRQMNDDPDSFPTKVHIGKRRVGFLISEVEEWLNERQPEGAKHIDLINVVRSAEVVGDDELLMGRVDKLGPEILSDEYWDNKKLEEDDQ